MILEPFGWACTLEECPPGLFTLLVAGNLKLGLKTDEPMARPAGATLDWHRVQIYTDDGGRWDCAEDATYLAKTMVQPVQVRWKEAE